MEFYKINAKNYELNVVFNGMSYVFFNSWCGIAAVANRTTPANKISSGTESFEIIYGNEHLIGGSLGYGAILPYVKKLINKQESKYIQIKVEYTEKRDKLEKYTAKIEISSNN